LSLPATDLRQTAGSSGVTTSPTRPPACQVKAFSAALVCPLPCKQAPHCRLYQAPLPTSSHAHTPAVLAPGVPTCIAPMHMRMYSPNPIPIPHTTPHHTTPHHTTPHHTTPHHTTPHHTTPPAAGGVNPVMPSTTAALPVCRCTRHLHDHGHLLLQELPRHRLHQATAAALATASNAPLACLTSQQAQLASTSCPAACSHPYTNPHTYTHNHTKPSGGTRTAAMVKSNTCAHAHTHAYIKQWPSSSVAFHCGSSGSIRDIHVGGSSGAGSSGNGAGSGHAGAGCRHLWYSLLSSLCHAWQLYGCHSSISGSGNSSCGSPGSSSRRRDDPVPFI
jgi:hypothetical protein